MLTQS